MRIGFLLYDSGSYTLRFDLGEIFLSCTFDRNANPTCCSYNKKDASMRFRFDDFDDFCQRVGLREPFGVYNPKRMQNEIIWCILSKLNESKAK